MAQLPSQSQFGDYGEWPGRDVLDSGGERLGGVREIYLDRETGRPEWVLVDVTDDEARFVPLANASVESSRIKVAHTAEAIRSAPGIGSEPRIDQSEERRLYDHYGLGYSDSGSGLPDAPPPAADPWGADEPKPEPFRSEERSWSAAAEPEPTNVAPPPAEPPSPDELERADIPEPPATSGFTATTEAPTTAGEVLAATPEAEAPTAPTTAGEILAATPEAEDLKAQPGPDAVRATEPPRIHAVPPPPPEPEDRRPQIAMAVAAALLLLILLRKLR
jgi:hypothetical protein